MDIKKTLERKIEQFTQLAKVDNSPCIRDALVRCQTEYKTNFGEYYGC